MTREWPVALLSGTLFGAGLAISGMADPQRVRGFLDIFGKWDPTLVFVMGGAVFVMVMAWIIQGKMASPLSREVFDIPTTTQLDAPLVIGAILFGIGWALAGLCPGPALIGLIVAPKSAVVFVIAMVAGMGLYRIVPGRN